MKVKELTDKELLELYKKNREEIINLFMILNMKENMEIVKELKKRGLFNSLAEKSKEEKDILEIMDLLNNEKVEELSEENENLRNNLASKNKETSYLKQGLKEYLVIASIVGAIDKGEYFKKRNYELSDKNIKELQNLYAELLDNIFEHYKVNSVKNIEVSNIINYSVKFLDKKYKAEEKENEWDEPVEGVKSY